MTLGHRIVTRARAVRGRTYGRRGRCSWLVLILIVVIEQVSRSAALDGALRRCQRLGECCLGWAPSIHTGDARGVKPRAFA